MIKRDSKCVLVFIVLVCLTLKPPLGGVGLQPPPLQVRRGVWQRQRGDVVKLQLVPVRLVIQQGGLQLNQDLNRCRTPAEHGHTDGLQEVTLGKCSRRVLTSPKNWLSSSRTLAWSHTVSSSMRSLNSRRCTGEYMKV